MKRALIYSLIISLVPCAVYAGSEKGQRASAAESFDPVLVEDAVDKLHSAGLITDKDFWISNAVPGKAVATDQITPLIIAAAEKFKPVKSLEAAVTVLHEHKVLQNPELWKAIQDKPRVAGSLVAVLLMALSNHIH